MSTQKSKQGFTLIELMVVIVIIGILAAIAIPKLFGMSAKAKASEVGPAAGTWSKLQQAYVLETDSLASFAKIGYTPPGNETSAQATPENKTSSTGSFDYAGTPINSNNSLSASWTATSKNKLGDCDKGAKWKVSITASDGKIQAFDEDTFEITAGENAGTKLDCEALTPNFTKLQ